MTGESVNNPHMSEFTFFLFLDSGWYNVDFSFIEPLSWGKNKGCNFLNKECSD